MDDLDLKKKKGTNKKKRNLTSWWEDVWPGIHVKSLDKVIPVKTTRTNQMVYRSLGLDLRQRNG